MMSIANVAMGRCQYGQITAFTMYYDSCQMYLGTSELMNWPKTKSEANIFYEVKTFNALEGIKLEWKPFDSVAATWAMARRALSKATLCASFLGLILRPSYGPIGKGNRGMGDWAGAVRCTQGLKRSWYGGGVR
jgi:hypothetical protein